VTVAGPEPRRRIRAPARAAQLLLVVAAAALWAGSRLPWVVIRSFDGLGQPRTSSLSGADWSTALVPLAVVSLAAAVAALAVRGWPLRLLAVLVSMASLAIGYLAVSLWVMRDVAVRAADLAHVPVVTLVGSERHYGGASLTLSAAVCTLIGSSLLMRAATSRQATTKYVTPETRRSMARGDDADDVMSERVLWDALDEGRDPTERRPDHQVPESGTEGGWR
jgi:uncharacterized membrane protein (TIGR02234 family)